MIDNHLTFREIEDYVARRLPLEQIPFLLKHVETCSSCSAMLRDSVIAAGTDHLTEKQVVDFVAGFLPASENQHARRHLESCAACAALVEDLEGFCGTLPAPVRPISAVARLWLLPVAAAVVLAAGVSVWLAVRPGPPASKVIAQLRDANGVLQLSDAGTLLAAANVPPDAAQQLKSVLRSGRLPDGPPEISANREILRSAAGNTSRPELRVVSPVGVRLVSDRPKFRWTPLGGAWSYRVTVIGEDLKPVASSGVIDGTSWTPEAPLPRLQTLLWQVTALGRGVRITAPAPPEPAARFELVSLDAARRIAAARAARPSSHLLLAILYSQAGLRTEAQAEIEAIASLNPGSPLAASLSGSFPPKP